MLRIVNKQDIAIIEDELDALVNLTTGKKVPSVITNLTGITELQILEEGVSKDKICAKVTESDDLNRYVNLFGYNPKYGVSGTKISSVKYLPQGYDRAKKLYEP